jgi:hypothetical protein
MHAPTVTKLSVSLCCVFRAPLTSTTSFSNGLTGGCLIGTSNLPLSATPNACGGTVTETWTATDSCGRALTPVSRTITISQRHLPAALLIQL